MSAATARADPHDPDDKATGRGMVIAAGIAVSAYGADQVAEEILRAAGIDTIEAMRRFGVDAYDVRILRHVLATIKRHRALASRRVA